MLEGPWATSGARLLRPQTPPAREFLDVGQSSPKRSTDNLRNQAKLCQPNIELGEHCEREELAISSSGPAVVE